MHSKSYLPLAKNLIIDCLACLEDARDTASPPERLQLDAIIQQLQLILTTLSTPEDS